MYNPKILVRYRKIEAFEVGERIAIDIMEPRRSQYIITGINYFTRIGFAKTISKKFAKNFLQFIKEIYSATPFKTLVSDGAKENVSIIISEWLKDKQIKHHIAIMNRI
jgi:hypothetical protein